MKALFLTPGTSQEMQKPLLKNIGDSLVSMGFSQPQLLYSDQCCHDRTFYESAFVSLTAQVEPIQKTQFRKLELPSQPIVVSNEAAIEDMVEKLRVQLVNSQESYAALDCEWTYDPVSHQSGPVSTIQLAVGELIYVVHLTHCRLRKPTNSIPGLVPEQLRMFLEDKTIKFVGKQIGGDVSKLRREYGVNILEYIELGQLAKRRNVISNAGLSLQDLCAKVLRRHLEKEEAGVRLSNWDVKTLSERQIKYAGLDAWASFEVFRILSEMAPVGEKLTPKLVRDGLKVTIHGNPQSTISVGRGVITIVPGFNSDTRVCVRITEVLAPSILVKSHGRPPQSLITLQKEVAIQFTMTRIRYDV